MEYLGRYELIIRFSPEKFTRNGTEGRNIFYIFIQNYFIIWYGISERVRGK